ncbi:MAG: hypothetical protein AB7O50_14760 [Pseudolabrys sp.]
MNRSIRPVIALSVAGTIALASLSPVAAAPVPTSTAQLKASAPTQVVDVRWRGRRGGAVAAGVAAGLIVGGIAAAAAGPRYYYEPGYAYGPPPVYYAPAPVYVEPAPVYVEPPAYYGPRDPNGPVRQCRVTTDDTRGYGYWRPC